MLDVPFLFFKFGPLCNARKNNSFTDAICDVEYVQNAFGANMSYGFKDIFRRGISILRDVGEDNKSEYEKNALQKLVGYLEKKGRPVRYTLNHYVIIVCNLMLIVLLLMGRLDWQ